MAVTTQITNVSYAGNVSTVTAYPVPFPFQAVEDLQVFVDGVALVLDSDYTVVGSAITTAAAVPALSVVLIQRVTPLLQPAVFQINGPLPSKSVETAFDRLTLIAQELLNATNSFFGLLGNLAARTTSLEGRVTALETQIASLKVEEFSGFIDTPRVGTYVLILSTKYPSALLNFTVSLATGSASLTLAGSTIAATTTPGTTNFVNRNLATGDSLILVVNSVSAAAGLGFTLKFQRP